MGGESSWLSMTSFLILFAPQHLGSPRSRRPTTDYHDLSGPCRRFVARLRLAWASSLSRDLAVALFDGPTVIGLKAGAQGLPVRRSKHA